MKKILLASSVVLLMAAGCNSSSTTSVTPVTQNTTPTPTSASASPTPTAMPTTATTNTLMLGSSASLGQYLTAANGMTLYTSNKDTAGVSNCTGACATSWSPYTVAAGLSLTAASGFSGKIGTIVRADGTTQVTYNSMPLYFWVNDAKAGDTTGQGVGGFAVVKP